MAQDCVDQAATLAALPERPCRTRELPIHGSAGNAGGFGELSVYGSDAPAIEAMVAAHPALRARMHASLPIIPAEVIWALRHEMARTVDDVLARRTRSLFLDARAAIEVARPVAQIMASELGRDRAWQDDQVTRFEQIARHYLPESAARGTSSGSAKA
jgi:glycerol-3-phosphate dehydrogenase